MNELIRAFRFAGYGVDVHLLSVDRKLSLLGIRDREEAMIRRSGAARVISVERHDQRYHALPNALARVAEAKLYDNITIYGRNVLNESTVDLEGIRTVVRNPESPVGEYLRERNKNWPEKVKTYFFAKAKEVIGQMRARNEKTSKITAFENDIGLSGFRKHSRDRLRPNL